MIEAYVDNLGKYVKGDPCGEWIKFPASQEDVKALFSKIGVDGVLYEEIIITDYRTDIDGLAKHLGEYESIDELNHLAALLSDMDDWDFEKFVAAVEYGEYTSSAKDLINITHNLDCYEFYSGVENEEDLGRYFIDELSALDIPEHLEQFFDYEAYGRYIDQDSSGVFSHKCGGYIELNGDSFIAHYGGRDDLPEEHRIFAYPDPPDKMPIAAQLEMYAKMITAPATGRLTPARNEIC
jgi:antirestriction protein